MKIDGCLGRECNGHRLRKAIWDGDEFSGGVLAKHVQGPGFIKIEDKQKKRRK